jgi:hypothetical protein
MKRKDFARLIDTIFAAKSGDEMLCAQYFDELPRFVDMEASGAAAASVFPEIKHHMHQCPECEEVYLALMRLVQKEETSGL